MHKQPTESHLNSPLKPEDSSFLLLLHCPPWSYLSVKSACDFAKAALNMNRSITGIFLYQDAVFNAALHLDIPSDELNGQQLLKALVHEHHIPIHLCITAAEKRGLNQTNIDAAFSIGGLAEFAESSCEPNRKIIQFK